MKLVLVILSGLIFSPLVMANERPCEKDIAAYCSDAEKGDGAVMKCLSENKDKLSAECKARGEWMKGSMRRAMKAHREDVSKACAEDLKTLCADAKPGHHAKMKCLRDKKDQVSGACKAEIEKTKKNFRKEMKKRKK